MQENQDFRRDVLRRMDEQIELDKTLVAVLRETKEHVVAIENGQLQVLQALAAQQSQEHSGA